MGKKRLYDEHPDPEESLDASMYTEAGYVVLGDDSFASPEDVQYHAVALPEYPIHEPISDEADRDNMVTPQTLRPENLTRGKGGSKNKGRKKAVRPLTPEQRMANRVQAMNQVQDVGPETENQIAERMLNEARAEMERSEKRAGGRPRKGIEKREVVTARLEPATREKLRELGITPSDAIEGYVGSQNAA